MGPHHLFVLLSFIAMQGTSDRTEFSPGDALRRVTVPPGYEARVYTVGVTGADGLALSPSGILYCVSETMGQVLRLGPDGEKEVVMDGLNGPEGIAVDGSGRILVTEDVEKGRLLALEPDSGPSVLSDSVMYSEGVAVSAGGDIFLTESNAEASTFPPFLTGIRRMAADGAETSFSSLYLWSLSDIVVSPSGSIIACNELSGYPLITESLLELDPASGAWTVLAVGLTACEGICATPGSFFPLYVAEEDTGDGRGRVSSIDSLGRSTVVAEGFMNIEDVAVDEIGRIFVSEDTTGMIIVLVPSGTPAAPRP